MGSLTKFNLNRIIGGFNTTFLFETGTFWGDGVAYAAEARFAKIISVEIIPEIANKARERFEGQERVTIIESDSVSALRSNVHSMPGNVLFWLDAHYPGADAGLSAYDSSTNEAIRLPLDHELQVIAERIPKFNDVILIDDLRIYEDGPYENGNASTETLPASNRNLDFIQKFFGDSHMMIRLYQDEGYILLIPKKNFARNHFSLRDFFVANPFPKSEASGQLAWGSTIANGVRQRRSELCKAEDFHSQWYEEWCQTLGEPVKIHRRQWEYAFVLQALSERDCITAGKTGIGFCVGGQPLPSILAERGCNIMGMDFSTEHSGNEIPNEGTPATSQSFLNEAVCDPESFTQRFTYRKIPFQDFPSDSQACDFNWSCSYLQQLGSREKCFDFIKNQLETLTPGGWAVHTMDFNLSSNDKTIANESIYIFRRRDIEEMVDLLRKDGHFVEELDFSLGASSEDFAVDLPPYKSEPHLRLLVDKHVITTTAIIVRKKQ